MSTVIEAELRERAGKGAARATRRAGRIPAVIYGEKQSPVMISVEPRALWAELKKPGFATRLFDIKVNGQSHHVIARDVQFHPVTDQPEHVDFQRVGARTVIHVTVPVHFANEDKSPGLKRGGVLNVVRHDVELVCPADRMPEGLTFDLTGAEIGDSLHISRLVLPEGVRPAIERDFTVATIAAPTVMKAAAEGGEG